MSDAKIGHTNRGASTRDRILELARKRLIDRGYEAFVIRELADELGIKLGNLQYYFKTKELLVFQLLQDEGARDVTILKGESGQTDAQAQFRKFVKELVARWRGDSGTLYSILSTLALHNKSYRQLYRSIYSTFYEALETSVRDINPDLSEEEAALRVRIITALIDGSPMQMNVGNLQTYLEEIQKQAERIALAK